MITTWVAFCFSLTIRIAVTSLYFFLGGQFFRGSVIAVTSTRSEKATWSIFLDKSRITLEKFTEVSIEPIHLCIVVAVIMCLVDSLIAMEVWRSQKSSAAKWLRCLSPLCLLNCAAGSTTPIEHFGLFLLVRLVDSKRWKLPATIASCLIVWCLGTDRLALLVPHIFFTILDRYRGEDEDEAAQESAAVTLAVSVFIVVMRSTSGASTALRHTPPDAGVSWYVWQLMIPYFDRPYAALSELTPVVLSLPVVMRSLGCTRLPYSPRRFAVIFSIAAAVVLGKSLSVSDLEVMVHLTAAYCPDIFDRLRTKSMLFFLSAFVCLPLQHAFYYGWLTTRVANPNWPFFVSLTFFCILVNLIASFLREGLAIGEAHTDSTERVE